MELSKQNIISMIGIIKANYPSSYKDTTREEFKIIVDLWYDMFKSYDYELVSSAFKKSLLKCKMPPTIADIQEQIDKLLEIGNSCDNEMWEDINSAIKKVVRIDIFNGTEYFTPEGTINPREKIQEIFNSLTDISKIFLGNYQTLWNYINYDEVSLSIEKTKFMKELPKIKEKVKVLKEMKQLVQNDILKIGNNSQK